MDARLITVVSLVLYGLMLQFNLAGLVTYDYNLLNLIITVFTVTILILLNADKSPISCDTSPITQCKLRIIQ